MGVHDAIRSTYLAAGRALRENRLREGKWFAEQEVDTWKNWVDMPLSRRLWLWRRGFTSPTAALYDFRTYDREAFLSETQCHRLYRTVNGPQRYLVDDKLSQHWLLADHQAHRPTVFGLLDGGHVHGVAGTALEGPPIPVDTWFPDALREHGKLVCKQVRGQGGTQVRVCEFTAGEYRLDGDLVTEPTLCETLSALSAHVITSHVDQHAYAEGLYSDASNTIRVFTMWDAKTGEMIIPGAVHRIGTDRSRPIDNFSAGGVAAAIDLDSGGLSAAAGYPFDGDVSRYDTHPDTETRILGVKVPHWQSVLETVESLAMESTTVPIIGWDVLIDRRGVPVVIEANTGPGVYMMQAHRPLLVDPQVRQLVARHLPEVDPPEDGRAGRDLERRSR